MIQANAAPITMDNIKKNRSSPTGVIDFDDDSTLSSATSFSAGLLLDVATNLQNDKETSFSPSSRSGRRKNRSSLPTLEESPGASHIRTNSQEFAVAMNDYMATPRAASGTEEQGLDHAEVSMLNHKASTYALRGQV